MKSEDIKEVLGDFFQILGIVSAVFIVCQCGTEKMKIDLEKQKIQINKNK